MTSNSSCLRLLSAGTQSFVHGEQILYQLRYNLCLHPYRPFLLSFSSHGRSDSGYKIGLCFVLPTAPLGVFYPELFLVQFLAQALVGGAPPELFIHLVRDGGPVPSLLPDLWFTREKVQILGMDNGVGEGRKGCRGQRCICWVSPRADRGA